jgi:enoyl-CoA hydratase
MSDPSAPDEPRGVLAEVDVDARIGWVVLNRPHVRNALNRDMLTQLQQVVQQLDTDPNVSVITVRGNGPTFCAGYDLTATSKDTAEYGLRRAIDDRRDLAGRITKLASLRHAAKPTVAAIHGACMGGGLQIAVFCDLVAVASSTHFGMPKLPVGAGFAAPTLSLKIGPARARQLAYIKGLSIDARQAIEWGLANFIFDDDALIDEVRALGRSISQVPAEILELEKLALNRVEDEAGRSQVIDALGDIDAIAHTSQRVENMMSSITEDGLPAVIARFEDGQE